MKKLLPIAAAVIFLFPLQAQNQQPMNYEQAWKKVAELEQKSLPKSASEQVGQILRKAIAEKNSPQTIKALIHRGKYDLALDAEQDTLIFRNLKEMLEKSTDVGEKSVLHSMLGELYLQYYQKDSWVINQRTTVSGFVPADMKEWTKNIFFDKVVEHLNASIEPDNSLEKAEVQPYEPVVTLGKDSRRFYPAMYDFLALRAIEFFRQIDEDADLSRSLAKKNITQQSLFAPAGEFVKLNFDPQPGEYNLWALETYRVFLASLQERKMNQSIVLTELDKLDYLSRLDNAYRTNALPSLEAMLKKWENQDFSVEIMDKMADFYLQKIGQLPQQDTLKRETQTKELYDLLQKTVRQFPKYERISLIENRISQLTHPEFSAFGNTTFAPASTKKITVTYKNLNRLTAKLYKLSSPLSVAHTYGPHRRKPDQETFVKDIVFTLPAKAPYLQGKTHVEIDINQYGAYKLEFDYSGKNNSEEYRQGDYYFSVSDLGAFSRSPAKNTYEFFVVNRVSGKPVKNAKVNIFRRTYTANDYKFNLVETVATNDLGLAAHVIKNEYNAREVNRDLFYQVVSGNDLGSSLMPLPYSYYEYSDRSPDSRETVTVFTDRSLYRPGQIVYFKAVAINVTGDKSEIAPNKSIEFVLRDANSQEVSKQTLKTNEFGSVSGEFVLPQGSLSGHYTLQVPRGGIGFRVEEYKRPTFEVSFDKIEKTYRFGEEITLKGKAENYSGVKLQDASVSYRITRQQSWGWRWGGVPMYFAVDHFAEGVTATDGNGQFAIVFTPQKSDEATSHRFINTFTVEATITDANGETQTAVYRVTVGDISMTLVIDIPDKREKNSEEKIVISAKNLDGNNISASGRYRIFSLHENDSVNTQVSEGNFTTGEQKELKEQLRKLPSAKYRIKLQSKDDRGNTVEAEKDVIVFSYSDKRPPIKTNEWFVIKNGAFSENKPAEILLGVTDEVDVLYELWQKETLLERKWLTLNNENRLFALPYKPEYKDGVTLMLAYVKDEKFFAFSPELLPEKESKELKIKLDVFRDKIRPGTNEEWRISIADAAGKPALAEVLAGMYDFSLDQIFTAPKWEFHLPMFGQHRSPGRLNIDFSFNQHMANAYIPAAMKNVTAFEFDRLNWFDFSLYRMLLRSLGSGRAQLESFVPSPMAKSEAIQIVTEDAASNVLAEEEIEITRRDATPPLAESPQIRRNFNETAFFFPQLCTNEQGETQIAFTVPESNTRWRFRVLAHDKNLNIGQTEAFATSQKELMVTPNMPRFLRHNDRTSISTKISNLSDGAVSGNVKLEFFNPVTDEMVNSISMENQSQSFSLAQNASSDVSWTFEVPGNIEVIGLRVVAESESFSDGEQHALAVLPNRMLVTESMRMDVNGTQAKAFEMERLVNRSSATAEDYRLTLELTSNPAWYAVQALPVLSDPESDNAVSWFASYYANTLGMHVSKAYPGVSAMIEAWKKQGGDSETLLSNLEKNPELKNVLLEETPWVLEARSESEQKRKLALLFDLNRGRHLARQAIDKLKELQTAAGGWAWFNGFQPSVGISQYILYGFSQLSDLKAADFSAEIRGMQAKAVSYVDAEAVRRFEQLKRHNKDWRKLKSVPSVDLEYLYVRSAYPQYKTEGAAKELTGFYTSVIEQNWTDYGLYERALIAVLMYRNGKSAIVQDILKSYREHATVSEETGMFWANNRARVFMSQSATSVHTFIMEAFRLGGASAAEMDNLKRWLLKQKQTQLWESTHATMDAVYVLLSAGSDWLSVENNTTVTVGGKVITPQQQELGTGYFKEMWHKPEITPQLGKVKIENSGSAPVWGALYWQYREDLDKITKTDGSLNVEKMLFVEETGASGRKLVPITENRMLRVGDKVVVRLTVRTDRDLEFVHLKDMCAAAFEPLEQLSGVKWQGGVVCFQASKDASTHFYFDVLPRGTYVLEYGAFVTRTGDYSNGITTVQCMYAPEFSSHTAGTKVNIR